MTQCKCCQSHLPALASTPCLRDRGSRVTRELTPHHNLPPPFPAPTFPRRDRNRGPSLQHQQTHSMTTHPHPRNCQSKSPTAQTSPQYPQAIRAGASSVVAVISTGQAAGKTRAGQHTYSTPTPPPERGRARGGRGLEGAWQPQTLLAPPGFLGAQARSVKAKGGSSIANCLLFHLTFPIISGSLEEGMGGEEDPPPQQAPDDGVGKGVEEGGAH